MGVMLAVSLTKSDTRWSFARFSSLMQGIPHFQFHDGDDGIQVGIAASLTVAVYGPLDNACACADSADTVCHGNV
jgi:hypothetical protein